MSARARAALTDALRGLAAGREVSRCLAAPRPVVVYTAPKTGSTSVEAALAEAGISAVKAHFLRGSHVRSTARLRSAGLPLERHQHVERRLAARLPAGDGARWRVIALTRDPVARRLSSVFQGPDRARVDLGDVEALRRHVAERVERMAAGGGGFAWFEDELGATFGVDPAAGFDAEAGFGRLAGRGADVIVLKMEALDRLAPVISEFVGRDLALRRRNERGATEHAERYRAARDGLRFPAATLTALYDHPLARAFYTEAERRAFRDRWAA